MAQSRARVEVRQNGYTLYSAYVSAGPFELDDLSVAGNGELEVIITETDGQVRRFTQPYATLSNLLRQGTWRYETSVGRYQPASQTLHSPLLLQASLARGIGWNSTVYGGLRHADFYQASTLGAARDMGLWGALASDVTVSHSQDGNHRSLRGQSYALRYGKHFPSRTYLRFAGYRYSTQGYRDLHEAVYEYSRSAQYTGNRRSRFEASLSQPIGHSASASLTFSQDDYWGNRPSRRQFQLTFSTSHRSVLYSAYLSQSLTLDPNQRAQDRQMGLSVSIPLAFGSGSSMGLSTLQSQGRWSQRASFGTRDEARHLSYNLALARSVDGQRTGTASIAYQGPQGGYNAGYSAGHNSHSLTASANGSVVIHADGIVLGPMAGDTLGLVQIPQVQGIGLQNGGRAVSDRHGYLVVPYLRPYRVNTLALNIGQLGADVELDNGALQVVPRRGAVVSAVFPARKVNRLVVRLAQASGEPVPFGAQARDAAGQVLGMVGQGGQLLLATSLEPQTLTLVMNDENEQCQAHLAPADWPEYQGLRQQQVTCQ